MYFDNISKNSKFPKQNLNSVLSSNNSTIETELSQTNIIVNEQDYSILWFFLWIAIFNMIILVLIKALQKLETVKIGKLLLWSDSQIPCRNCIFFAKNQYLKCAVHPFNVLTKQAINCSDYCKNHQS